MKTPQEWIPGGWCPGCKAKLPEEYLGSPVIGCPRCQRVIHFPLLNEPVNPNDPAQKLRDLMVEVAKAEVKLLKSIGMRPCGPSGDVDGWWCLPDHVGDGQAYKRSEACQLHLTGVRITS